MLFIIFNLVFIDIYFIIKFYSFYKKRKLEKLTRMLAVEPALSFQELLSLYKLGGRK